MLGAVVRDEPLFMAGFNEREAKEKLFVLRHSGVAVATHTCRRPAGAPARRAHEEAPTLWLRKLKSARLQRPLGLLQVSEAAIKPNFPLSVGATL